MNKNFKNIIILYVLFAVIVLFILFYSTRIVYNKLIVIDNLEYSKKTFSIKVPTKMTINNKYLGTATLTDNLLMNDILQSFDNIISSNGNDCHNNKINNVVSLSGEIFYSNGTTEKFSVSDTLVLGGKVYCNNSYSINTLRNALFNNIYTYSNILKIIKNDDSKIIYEKNNSSLELNNNQKNNLLEKLKTFSTIEDNKDFLNINLNEKPKGLLKVFINGSKSSNSNNTIYITFYNNYLVIQYLGDENGKKIYIKGDLNEKDFK